MRLLTVILGCLSVATTCAAQTPNWTQIKPTTSPSARADHAMVYDSARQRTVLFGGLGYNGSWNFFGDTWEYDGRTWTQIKPATSPSSRHGFAMVYDSARQRTVLFGGRNAANLFLGDTWEYDGKTWTQIKPRTSPLARFTPAMAYDSVRQRAVLFGGDRGTALSDTWEWDGANWSRRYPTTSPQNMQSGKMAYDSARQRTVLFGFAKDTWEWDGQNWSRFTPESSPSSTSGPAMIYDTARQRTVLFGGRNLLTSGWSYRRDAWEWAGRNWTRVAPIRSPSPRAYAGMAYDSVRQRTVVFGGAETFHRTVSDTWEYGIPTLTLTPDTPTISITNGGRQNLTLNAGTGLARKSYWIFGSATSTMPGVVLTGIHIPLRPDIYTTIALGAVNTTVFTKFMGPLSATGTATASLIVPKMLSIPTGFKLYHAYVVFDGTTGQIFTSSNPVSVEFK